jgi:hypothetical protein
MRFKTDPAVTNDQTNFEIPLPKNLHLPFHNHINNRNLEELVLYQSIGNRYYKSTFTVNYASIVNWSFTLVSQLETPY